MDKINIKIVKKAKRPPNQLLLATNIILAVFILYQLPVLFPHASFAQPMTTTIGNNPQVTEEQPPSDESPSNGDSDQSGCSIYPQGFHCWELENSIDKTRCYACQVQARLQTVWDSLQEIFSGDTIKIPNNESSLNPSDGGAPTMGGGGSYSPSTPPSQLDTPTEIVSNIDQWRAFVERLRQLREQYNQAKEQRDEACRQKTANLEKCLQSEYQKEIEAAEKNYQECLEKTPWPFKSICKRFNEPYYIWRMFHWFNPCNSFSSQFAKLNHNPCADTGGSGGSGSGGSGGGGGGSGGGIGGGGAGGGIGGGGAGGIGGGGTGGGSGNGGSGSGGSGSGGSGSGGGDGSGGSGEGGDDGSGSGSGSGDGGSGYTGPKLPPELIAPEDDADYTSGDLTFEWKAKDEAVPEKYIVRFQLDGKDIQYWTGGQKDMETETKLVIPEADIKAIFKKQDNIPIDKPFTWTWWVSAMYPDDTQLYASETRTINVAVINAPTITNPTDNPHLMIEDILNIEWKPGFEDNPDKYILQMTGATSGAVFSKDDIKTTTYSLTISTMKTLFPNDTEVKLQVGANIGGAIALSSILVLQLPSYTPALVTPINGSYYAGGDVIFQWQPGAGSSPTSYIITIKSGDKETLISPTSPTGTSITIGESQMNYYKNQVNFITWKVTAKFGSKSFDSETWTLNF